MVVMKLDSRRMTPPSLFDAPGDSKGVFVLDIATGFSGPLFDRVFDSNPRYAEILRSSPMLLANLRTLTAREVTRISLKTLVLELNLAGLGGSLQGGCDEERYGSYINALGKDWYLRYLFSKYPVLDAKIHGYTRARLDEALRIIGCIEDDIRQLDFFLGMSGSSVISKITPLGDPHNGGQRASEVEFVDGKKLMYKPRGAGPEQLFGDILALTKPDQHNIAIPRFVDRGSYHWQECVEPTLHLPPGYYEDLGALLAIAYYTASMDLHFENIIPTANGPVAVDMECTTSGRPEGIYLDNGAFDPNLHNLSDVGILPNRMSGRWTGEELNWGALGGYENAEYGVPRLSITNDGTPSLKIDIARSSGGEFRDSQAKKEVLSAYPEFTAGFKRMASQIAEVKEELLHLLASSESRNRVVVRPTQVYGEVHEKGLHPAALVSKEAYLKVIGDTIRKVSPSGLSHLSDDEAKSLLFGDVPLYSARAIDSHTLEADVRLRSGLSIAKLRLADFASPATYTRAHADYIEKTIVSYITSDDGSQPTDTVIAAPETRADADLDAITSLATEICRDSTTRGKSVYFHNVSKQENGKWAINRSGYDLYSGTAGVFLALQAAHKVTGFTVPDNLGRDLFNHFLEIAEDPGYRHMTVGAFSGAASLAYTIAAGHLYGFGTRAEVTRAIDTLLTSMIKMIPNDETFDVISGAAGVMLVLQELRQRGFVAEELHNRLQRTCVDHLENHKIAVGRGASAWPYPTADWLGGLSHGVAGIAWATRGCTSGDAATVVTAEGLAKAAWSAQEILKIPGRLAWQDRRSTDQDGVGDLNTWCHGAEGMLLIQMLRPGAGADELIEAANALRTITSANDPSLCHGEAGRLVTLNMADEILESRGLSAGDSTVLKNRLVERLSSYALQQRVVGHSAPLLWDSGLLVGRAGIIQALAYNRVGRGLPNPLALRLPEP